MLHDAPWHVTFASERLHSISKQRPSVLEPKRGCRIQFGIQAASIKKGKNQIGAASGTTITSPGGDSSTGRPGRRGRMRRSTAGRTWSAGRPVCRLLGRTGRVPAHGMRFCRCGRRTAGGRRASCRQDACCLRLHLLQYSGINLCRMSSVIHYTWVMPLRRRSQTARTDSWPPCIEALGGPTATMQGGRLQILDPAPLHASCIVSQLPFQQLSKECTLRSACWAP